VGRKSFMSNAPTLRQYVSCLKEILLRTFKDKKLLVHFSLGLIMLGVGIFSTLTVPLLFKMAVDSFSNPATTGIPLILISYGLIWMISQVSLHVRALLTYKIEQRITYVLGIKVFDHLYSLSQKYFLDQKPGAITNVIRRAQRDVPSLTLGIFFHVLPTILEFLCVIILITQLYSLFYSLFLGGTLVIFFIYTLLSMKMVVKDREKANEVDKETDGIITDWLSHYEIIKTFGQRNLAIKTCEQELKKREEAEVTFMTKMSFIDLGQSLILGLTLTCLTYFVGKGVLEKALTVGDFVLFNGYVIQFILPISILGQVTQDIKKAFVDMKGILEILLTKSEVKEARSPHHLSNTCFSLEFKNVSFTYNDRAILKNISFTVEPKETVLIVGPTGIGKSTLAKLILRLYDPTEGQILINHTNLNRISLQSLYETIGWVPQESSLLNDTIENNLRLARPDANLKDMEAALDQANLLNFIKRLPKGLKTKVGDRGIKLSGGEKQRLSLARLFLKKPQICIFDEPTSFLDRNTELTIQKNLETFFPHMTKIIITHRPFMVNNVNKIITLDKKSLVPKEVSYEFKKFSNFI
jgi:ABC-type transport system involved in Fe-S cluster assembly fused permease/ATPase subunit